jgi:hypothetical protein
VMGRLHDRRREGVGPLDQDRLGLGLHVPGEEKGDLAEGEPKDDAVVVGSPRRVVDGVRAIARREEAVEADGRRLRQGIPAGEVQGDAVGPRAVDQGAVGAVVGRLAGMVEAADLEGVEDREEAAVMIEVGMADEDRVEAADAQGA